MAVVALAATGCRSTNDNYNQRSNYDQPAISPNNMNQNPPPNQVGSPYYGPNGSGINGNTPP
jgi:hypothetical protein